MERPRFGSWDPESRAYVGNNARGGSLRLAIAFLDGDTLYRLERFEGGMLAHLEHGIVQGGDPRLRPASPRPRDITPVFRERLSERSP